MVLKSTENWGGTTLYGFANFVGFKNLFITVEGGEAAQQVRGFFLVVGGWVFFGMVRSSKNG